MTRYFTLLAALGMAASASASAAPASAAPASSAQAAAPAKIMPAELRGNWYEAVDEIIPMCTDEDLGLLQVDSGTFVFPLEVGTLIDIVERPIDTYRLRFYGEEVSDGPAVPRASKQTQIWTLSPDGKHLNIVGKGMALDLFRCRPQPSE